jgi:hypothetical protein
LGRSDGRLAALYAAARGSSAGVDPPRPISDQPVQQFEPDRWNDEQIDAGDGGGVIAQETLPQALSAICHGILSIQEP